MNAPANRCVILALAGALACSGESAAGPERVILTPSLATVRPGSTQQFSVSHRLSDGSTQPNPSVSWTATGGTITPAGLYTAGGTTGSFQVIAALSGGTLADTAVVTVSPSGAQTYTTTFPLAENPLSENGRWVHTDALLTPCKVVDGKAFGTQPGGGGYDDSNAYLTGYGNDYEIEGTVWINPALSGTGHREVEILLRWTDDNPVRATPYGDTHANGYEINVNHAGDYMILGRFKGAALKEVNNFASPRSGDRFRARIEGQRIRVWWNDVLKIDYTDSNSTLQVTTGNPGIGFFVDGGASTTDFGFDAVTVTTSPSGP